MKSNSIHSFSPYWLLGGIIIAAFGTPGCGKPEPPVLVQNLAEYQDEREGFSMRPPSGWIMQNRAARAERDRETILVKYKRSSGNQLGVFQISAIDLPEGSNITEYLDKTFGKAEKRTSTKPEDVKVGGLAGTRDTFSGKWDREAIVKEVVAVRRGPRVYFFTGIYPPADKETRDATRKALDAVEWQDERKS